MARDESPEYGDFFRFAPEMLCITGLDGALKAASLSWEEAFGAASDKVASVSLGDLVHPEDREAWDSALDELRGGAKVVARTLRLRRAGRQEGGYLRVLWRASMREAREEIYVVAHDRTEVYGELRYFKALADATTDYIGIASPKGEMVYMNPGGLELLGRAGQDVRAIRVQDRMAPEAAAKVSTEAMPTLLGEGRWTGESEFLHASGEKIPVMVATVAIRGAEGKPEVFVTIAHDLRPQKRTEAFLRRFKSLADAAPNLIGLANADTSVVYMNPAGLALVGREGQDFTKLALPDFLSERAREHFAREVMPALLRDGVWMGESELQHVNGARIPVFRSITLLRNEAGEPESLASILHDLRPQKRLEEALRRSIREMATPIIEVWEGVLALPVIGLVDRARAAQMTEALLDRIVKDRCRVAILDLTGVETIDASTVNHLFEMVSAAALLGSRCVVSGISSQVARTVASLGLDLARLSTFRSLREALRFALEGDEGPIA